MARGERRVTRRAKAPPATDGGGALHVRSKIWLERDGKVALSEWRIALLEAVEETGSLSHAADRMGVPYRTAWYKLKDIEKSLGIKLLDTQSGGSEGGHSDLTPEARELMARFRRVTAGFAGQLEARFRAEFGELLG